MGEQLRFICQVGCQSGRDTATNGSTSNTNQSSIPPESYFTVPYSINNGNQQLTLSTKTLAVTVAHHDGELEYNLHNLYGLYEVIATYRQLITMRQKRPFILTRWAVRLLVTGCRHYVVAFLAMIWSDAQHNAKLYCLFASLQKMQAQISSSPPALNAKWLH